jgi:adenosine deaminase
MTKRSAFAYTLDKTRDNVEYFSSFHQVNLAMEMKDQGVVGIDLSGNPVVGEW